MVAVSGGSGRRAEKVPGFPSPCGRFERFYMQNDLECQRSAAERSCATTWITIHEGFQDIGLARSCWSHSQAGTSGLKPQIDLSQIFVWSAS